MTSVPGFRPTVEARLVQLVRQDRLSTRAAISRVRSEGYRIGNDRARGILNLAFGKTVTGSQRSALGLGQAATIRTVRGANGRQERIIRASYRVVAPIIAQVQGAGGRNFSAQPTIRGERQVTINVQGFQGRQTLIAAFQKDFKNSQEALARQAVHQETGVDVRYITGLEVGPPTIELRRRPQGSRIPGQSTPNRRLNPTGLSVADAARQVFGF